MTDATLLAPTEGFEVGAGIRQPAAARVAAHPGQRLVEPRLMEIRQAVATPHRAAAGGLSAFVDELAASGWAAERAREIA